MLLRLTHKRSCTLAVIFLFGALSAQQAVPQVESSVGSSTRAPSVSIRGRYNGKLVFTSDRHNSGLSIWTMNPDGSSPTRLTHPQPRGEILPIFVRVYDDGPVWSPDGTKIAFFSNRNYTFALYTMNADGSDLRLVTDQVPNPTAAAWSPDGTKIALVGGLFFAIPPGDLAIDIYTVNVDGSGLTKLTKESGLNGSPTWSPDGSQIAFSSNRDPDQRHKIWVMNADGSNQRRLTDIHNTSNPLFYGDGWPSWSPDGSSILFTGYRDFNGARNCFEVNCLEIFVMNADGTNDHPLTNDPNRGGIYQLPRWSPDGTKIVTSVELGTLSDVRNGIDLGRGIIVMNADGSDPINISTRSGSAFFDVSVDWQPLTAPPNFPSSVLGFSSTTFSAYEDIGSIPVTVTRTGNLNGVASCFYATEDGTATSASNYAAAFGTLNFTAGEASKTISIPLTDNGHAQGNVSFKIKLWDNEGNATLLGGIRETTVTVLDRDTVPRARNPIDDARPFVRQHYVDFLNREPDVAGLAFWMEQITSCGADERCIDIKRQHVSAAFFLSVEFQETGFFVKRVYKLGGQGTSFLRDSQRIGAGVVVGQAGWEQRLEANKTEWIQQLFDEDKVITSFGFTNEQFVDLLFQYGELTPTQAERDALVAELNAGTATRPGVFRRVVEDQRLRDRLFRETFVFMQYIGYLRRNPDVTGFNFWLDKLNQFNGDYIAAEMVKAFLVASEYRGRFGQP